MKESNRREGAAKEVLVEKVKAYLKEHPADGLSLDEIAGKLNYSKFYMERTFAQVTGMSIGKYIRECRLADAAQQLAQTGRPVTDIAYDAGYGSPQAFTQAFRRRYLCPPLLYRKMHQKNGILSVNGVGRVNPPILNSAQVILFLSLNGVEREHLRYWVTRKYSYKCSKDILHINMPEHQAFIMQCDGSAVKNDGQNATFSARRADRRAA